MKNKLKDMYIGLYTFGLVIATAYSLWNIVKAKDLKEIIIYIIAIILFITGIYFVIKSLPKEEEHFDIRKSFK